MGPGEACFSCNPIGNKESFTKALFCFVWEGPISLLFKCIICLQEWKSLSNKTRMHLKLPPWRLRILSCQLGDFISEKIKWINKEAIQVKSKSRSYKINVLMESLEFVFLPLVGAPIHILARTWMYSLATYLSQSVANSFFFLIRAQHHKKRYLMIYFLLYRLK